MPDIGEPVACLFSSQDCEQGFVLGVMYGRQSPPVASGDKWHRKFSDGAYLEYDRKSHALKAEVPGMAEIKCASSITLEAPIIYLRGTLQNTAQDGSPGKSVFSGGMEVMNGGINAMDGDIVASGVSLASHTTAGVMAGDRTSSHPTGGSSESPGTAAKALPAVGTAAYLATITSRLENLKEEKSIKENPVYQLILCLPKITNTLAEKSSNALDRQGFIYLHDFFERWLAGELNSNPFRKDLEPMRVKFDWLVAFVRSSRLYQELIQPEILFNKKAQEVLQKILKRDGFLGKEPVDFDYINSPWWEWKSNHYQSRGVPSQKFLDIGTDLIVADGLQAAMASCMLYALANGTVTPLENYKYKYKITIKNVGIAGFDTFNFDGDQTYYYWRCTPPDWSIRNQAGYTELTNNDFVQFHRDTGHGCAFPVIAGPKLLDITSEFIYYVNP